MRQAPCSRYILALAALAVVSCQGRERANYTVQPNPQTNGEEATGVQPTLDPITGEPVVALPGAVAPGAPKSEDPAQIAAATGLTTVQIDRGRVYVNGWAGEKDDVTGPKWQVKNVADDGAAAAAGPTSTITPTTPATGGTPPTADAATSASNPDVVEFRIKKGTGNGAWNTKETEVVAKVSKRFVIYNDDDVVHQWHTDGTPCPHGNPIAPGRSAECVPSAKYSGPALYDHNTRGEFYFRAE